MTKKAETRKCIKCGTDLILTKNYYTHRDGHYDDMCKQCLCMHVNNFKPETFEWILKRLDYPYVRQEWDRSRNQAIKKNGLDKMTGVSVMGRYISKMKLAAWQGLGYQDSERLQADYDKATVATQIDEDTIAALRAKLDAGEISQAEFDTFASDAPRYTRIAQNEEDLNLDDYKYVAPVPVPPSPIDQMGPGLAQYFEPPEPEYVPVLDIELTPDEEREMMIKWGRDYRPEDWVKLEEYYNNMLESFEIEDADSLATLKFICKTDLKMNQALDMEDYESFQKLSRVSSDLRKTAKFTAAQNKAQSNEAYDCVGKLVYFCEQEGGKILKDDFDYEQDKVDTTLADNQRYLFDLVTQDPTLAKQIEEVAVKLARQQAEAENQELSDEEIIDYLDEVERQLEEDNKFAEDEFDDVERNIEPVGEAVD